MTPEEIIRRVVALRLENDRLRKENEFLKSIYAELLAEKLERYAKNMNGVKMIIAEFKSDGRVEVKT